MSLSPTRASLRPGDWSALAERRDRWGSPLDLYATPTEILMEAPGIPARRLRGHCDGTSWLIEGPRADPAEEGGFLPVERAAGPLRWRVHGAVPMAGPRPTTRLAHGGVTRLPRRPAWGPGP